MRVLLVLTSLTTGGVQSTVKTLASELVAAGHEVAVVSLCGRDSLPLDERVARWSLGYDGLRGFSALRATMSLRRILRQYRPDVVHSHAFHSNLVSALALGPRAGARHVATLHSVREGGWLHATIAPLVYSSGRTVVAVSGAVAAAHRLTNRAHVVQNAVNVEAFAFRPRNRARIRDELGVAPETTLVVSVGRLTEAKDYTRLVRAVAEGVPRGSSMVVGIAGGGAQHENLTQEIAALAVGDRVRLLGPRGDIPALLSAADVYVQSSAWEGFPVALLEAMSAGLPIIATAVGGTEELRPKPKVVIPPEHTGALAAAIADAASLVQDEATRARAPQELGRYELTAWCAKWLRIYCARQPG